MSLYDHIGSGGNVVPEGQHVLTVTGTRRFNYNSGNPGLEVTLSNGQQQTIKTDFVLIAKSLWRLASFASALGLTEADLRTYDERNPACDRMLLNRRALVTVVKPDKYHEVSTWEPVPAGYVAPPTAAPVAAPAAVATPPPATATNATQDDDLPF